MVGGIGSCRITPLLGASGIHVISRRERCVTFGRRQTDLTTPSVEVRRSTHGGGPYLVQATSSSSPGDGGAFFWSSVKQI
jgi:hypothetical protein